jgi:outer membrane lipoprotein-sorting protein
MEFVMTFTRRTLTLALAAAALGGPALAQQANLSDQDRALVQRATAYLEGLKEAKGRFIQTDPRGQTTTGTLYLKRPGKARFAYDPPSGQVVVSDGHTVAVADSRLMTFNRYPLGATPLALFLDKTIRLDRGVQVIGVSHALDGFTIDVRDGNRQNAGRLSLTFAENPLRLIGWTVTDAQGRNTRVQLIDLAPAAALDPQLFVQKDPRRGPIGPG